MHCVFNIYAHKRLPVFPELKTKLRRTAHALRILILFGNPAQIVYTLNDALSLNVDRVQYYECRITYIDKMLKFKYIQK